MKSFAQWLDEMSVTRVSFPSDWPEHRRLSKLPKSKNSTLKAFYDGVRSIARTNLVLKRVHEDLD